jgi:AraC-like DNA-binding protein
VVESGVDFQIVRPHSSVAGLVAYYWVLQVPMRSVSTPELMIPDGYDEVIFSYREGFCRRPVSGNPAEVVCGSYVVGGRSETVTAECVGASRMMGIKLLPGGLYRLTGQSPSEMGGRPLPLTILGDLGLLELEDRLVDIQDIEKIGSVCDAFLRARANERPADPLIERAVHRIAASRGVMPVRLLSEELALHLRTLEKRVRLQLGLSLKTLARITRFKYGFSGSRGGRSGYLRQALGCGYCDQSHFIREFRHFAGMSPSGLSKTDQCLSTSVIETSFGHDVSRRSSGT